MYWKFKKLSKTLKPADALTYVAILFQNPQSDSWYLNYTSDLGSTIGLISQGGGDTVIYGNPMTSMIQSGNLVSGALANFGRVENTNVLIDSGRLPGGLTFTATRNSFFGATLRVSAREAAGTGTPIVISPTGAIYNLGELGSFNESIIRSNLRIDAFNGKVFPSRIAALGAAREESIALSTELQREVAGHIYWALEGWRVSNLTIGGFWTVWIEDAPEHSYGVEYFHTHVSDFDDFSPIDIKSFLDAPSAPFHVFTVGGFHGVLDIKTFFLP